MTRNETKIALEAILIELENFEMVCHSGLKFLSAESSFLALKTPVGSGRLLRCDCGLVFAEEAYGEHMMFSGHNKS